MKALITIIYILLAAYCQSCGTIEPIRLDCDTDMECYQLTGCDFSDLDCINFDPANWSVKND